MKLSNEFREKLWVWWYIVGATWCLIIVLWPGTGIWTRILNSAIAIFCAYEVLNRQEWVTAMTLIWDWHSWALPAWVGYERKEATEYDMKGGEEELLGPCYLDHYILEVGPVQFTVIVRRERTKR